MGKSLSPLALTMIVEDLKEHKPELIVRALKRVRNGLRPFSQGAIVDEISQIKNVERGML